MANTLAYYKTKLITAIKVFKVQVPYSQYSIFFVTYESAQYGRLFHNSKLERFTSNKHSNLLGQFLSYE